MCAPEARRPSSFFKNKIFLALCGRLRLLRFRQINDDSVTWPRTPLPADTRVRQSWAANVSKIEQNVPPAIGILVGGRTAGTPFGASNTSIEREVLLDVRSRLP